MQIIKPIVVFAAAVVASSYLRLLMSHTTYISRPITAYPDISGWYLGVFYHPAAWRQRWSRSVNSQATAQPLLGREISDA